jgi:iron complex transport system substrate-binding protein
VISLIASATEIVCALGLEHVLAGRSHECDYPPSVTALPVCTEPRFEVSGSSREIDESVRSLLRQSQADDALSVYRVHRDVLRELQPSHIVTQAQCEVCAVSLKDVEHAVAQIAGCEAKIISLQPNSLSDTWEDIGRVAVGLDVAREGRRLVESLRRRMRKIREKTLSLDPRPTVACIEWADPLMAAGNWTPELVEMAGGINLFGIAGRHSPGMTFEDLLRQDPDVILIAPCGFSLERTRQDLPLLAARPEWSSLKAVRNGRVYLADGNQYFNRPGPRVAETLEILAEILHPDVFAFGHEGTGWEFGAGA